MGTWLSGFGGNGAGTARPARSDSGYRWALVLSLLVAGADGHAGPRLVLHDFERPNGHNNLGGPGRSWLLSSGPDPLNAAFVRRPIERSGHALYLSYAFAAAGDARAGYWTLLPRLDARPFDHLELWVKGDHRAGFGRSFEIAFSRPYQGRDDRSESAGYLITGVTGGWQRFRVPLNAMLGFASWTDLSGLSIGFHARRMAPRAGAYYIDDIALVRTGYPGPSAADPVATPKKRAWMRAHAGAAAVRGRLRGWPRRTRVDRRGLGERELLMRIAADTWRGIDAFTDRDHGLPLDTIAFAEGSGAPRASRIGDYTTPTDIGLYLLALTGAWELRLIDRPAALDRLYRVLATLARLASYRGFLFNYYDTTSLERTSHFVSTVDCAWLSAGLMVARTAFPEVQARSTQLLDGMDFGLLYDPVERLLWQGYHVNLARPSAYHYGLFYTEARIASFIAIGKGDVPREHWFAMARTLPTAMRWQTQRPKGMRPGRVPTGGYYEWQGRRFVPSWGGSLFEALMPTLVLDETRLDPAGLGANDRVHAEVQRRYALDVLGYPVWGMSPSASVATRGYAEFGVPVLGTSGYPSGVVTPHASALALAVIPTAASHNLRTLVERFDIYGEFGFYDALDPRTGAVANTYLALDQAMLFVALVNHLENGAIQRHFARDPRVQRALPLIGEEHFFE